MENSNLREELGSSNQFLSLQSHSEYKFTDKFVIERTKDAIHYKIGNAKLMRVAFGCGNHVVEVFGRDMIGPLVSIAEFHYN